MECAFTEPNMMNWLEAADEAALDALPFGVISMTPDGIVTGYNSAESLLSGLAPAKVIGRRFFTAVAPCTNNWMVAYRFETEPTLDAIISYVFTFGMKPTAVRLRLLKAPQRQHMYLAVEPT